MENILDDNETINQDDDYQLRQPKFVKRIRIFAILALVNAVFLFLMSIGFFIYGIILMDYQYSNDGEITLCYCATLFSFIGSLLLFQTYRYNNKFAKKPDDTSFLIKGMNYFFRFWLALILNFVLMGFILMIWR